MHKRVKLRIIMFRLLAVLAMLSAWVNGAHSSPNDSVKVLPDSSNFVTASLVIVSPANEIYSVFGHTAIRMECPVHNLDYVFTFESDPTINEFITFFAGKAKARFIAAQLEDFLEETKRHGRGVRQYELNLTHHEKQQLWRLLDEDMLQGAHRKFNLLLNNCVSMSVLKLHQCLIDEYMEWGPWQGSMLLNNGDLVRYNARRSAWAEFLFVTFLGTGYSDYYDQELRLCPEIIVQELRRATIVNTQTGSVRHVITDKGKEILPESKKESQYAMSPTFTFALLLGLVLLITFAEWRWNWIRLSRWLDIILFISQSLIGILLVYITFVSEIFGLMWNWYLIPFNPIPLILWICLRKLRNYGRIYLLYTLILVAFIVMTPFIPQLDVSHQLLSLVMVIRCFSNYMKYSKKEK